MSKVTVAAVQMTYGLENAMEKVREAASQGAQIILLPELFENWYFCQERSYENYHLATTLEENPAVRELRKVAHDFRVVLPVSYYERVGNTTFNTVAVIDAIALIESGLAELCTVTIGVTAPREVRIERLIAREGVTRDYAEARIDAQKPNEWFAQHCSYVLDNGGTLADFQRRCHQLIQEVLS